MKIMLLAKGDVGGWYAASLMQRGHQVDIWGGGSYKPSKAMANMVAKNDACLLIGSEADHLAIADYFAEAGKQVFRELPEVPRNPPPVQ
jgi:prephenate dehydrogenase